MLILGQKSLKFHGNYQNRIPNLGTPKTYTKLLKPTSNPAKSTKFSCGNGIRFAQKIASFSLFYKVVSLKNQN